MGRTVSLSRSAKQAPELLERAWRKVDRWLYTTPLGFPVVPLV
jgi:hypothetical protein